MTLWPAQADALLGALEANGLYAPLQVGAGKTLLAALLPTIFNARRALVLTTASLEEQTRRLFRQYAEHWHIRKDITIASYSFLSLSKNAHWLEKLHPNIIIADEAHALRDHKSARTKRFLRHFKDNPTTMFAPLSGTMSKRSIKDAEHLAYLALKTWSPFPHDYPILKEWSEALDPDPARPAGALLLFCEGDESPREGFARRVRETRGVASSPAEALGSTLIVETVEAPESDLIAKARTCLANTWERPDGEELTQAMEVAMVDHQLRLGGCYQWIESPPREWLAARRAWHRGVRKWLQHNSRPGVDSPKLLEDALRDRKVTDSELMICLAEWDALRHIPEPPKEWRSIDTTPVEWAVRWGTENTGIIFTDIVAIGHAVAKAGKFPYYGAGKNAAVGILEEKGKRSIVCSLQAQGQGRNLQVFNRGLLLGIGPGGDEWEQVLGRMHRSGQLADEVVYSVPSWFSMELDRATEDCRFQAETSGQARKLLTCNRSARYSNGTLTHHGR